MSYVLYAYVAKPTVTQVENFLRSLAGNGVPITHLGKKDPPRKFDGNVGDAALTVCSGKDLTDWTFARDAARVLELDFEIHHDPRWTHSTVSATCPDTEVLGIVGGCAVAAFDLFIAVRGVSGEGKGQHWEVVHVTDKCPHELRSKFVTG